ncbi:DUF1931 domain-containing protein [Candidatus Woesearchaeota archaeon]|nr:DUF1931 domain-containing protein [Candidatus Woesearchaeota archaeon]
MALINKSELKNLVGDMKISTEFYPALNMKVEELVRDSIRRAKENQRTTLMARDV